MKYNGKLSSLWPLYGIHETDSKCIPLPPFLGKPVELAPEAEEVCSFFAAILESDHVKNPTFVSNFFADFQKILKDHPPVSHDPLSVLFYVEDSVLTISCCWCLARWNQDQRFRQMWFHSNFRLPRSREIQEEGTYDGTKESTQSRKG